MSDVPDILTIAAHGVDYYQSEGRPLPESLTIWWAMSEHFHSGRPHLLGVQRHGFIVGEDRP